MTYQDVVDLARLPLNDADKDRYDDPALFGYAQSGVLLLLDRRPDLFFGNYANLPDVLGQAIGEDVPIADRYQQALADYITARAETHDDEHVVSGRAKLFFDLAAGQV